MLDGIKGFGTEGVVIITLYLLVKEMMIPMWKKIQLKRANGNGLGNPGNPNGKPGKARECIEHVKQLATIKEAITTIKDQVNKIWEKLDTKQDKK